MRRANSSRRQAGGVDVAAEILQQVGAALYRFIKVEAGDAAGRARDEAVGLGQHHSGLVVCLHEAGSHDADYSLAPARVIDHGGVFAGKAAAAFHHLQGLFRDLAVDALAVVVVGVDLLPYEHGLVHVFGGQELHRETA